MILQVCKQTRFLNGHYHMANQGLKCLNIILLKGVPQRALDIKYAQQLTFVDHGDSHGGAASFPDGEIVGILFDITREVRQTCFSSVPNDALSHLLPVSRHETDIFGSVNDYCLYCVLINEQADGGHCITKTIDYHLNG